MRLNASQTTWTPVPPATALTLHSAMSLDIEHQEHLFLSATALLSATSLDAEHQGCLPLSATALARSALPRHPTLSIEDAPGPLSATSLDVERRGHLPWSATALAPLQPSYFAMSPNVECRGRLRFATALLSATSSIENASHCLPLPYQKPHNTL